ncbi:MAG: PQQ-binding-like beta-propeller repeat protein, partial [Pseudomonadota bacterium]
MGTTDFSMGSLRVRAGQNLAGHVMLGMGMAFLALALAACGQREPNLQGERLDIRAPLDGEAPAEPEVRADRLAIPAPAVNAAWTHRNGSAEHTLRHPALNSTLTRVWGANIGTGNSRKLQITGDPIVAGGRVFAMDASAGVRAFTPAGDPVWTADLTPPNERNGEVSGGGLAFGSGILAATTGHGDVFVLDPATGDVRWRHRMPGSISVPPVITGDVVVAVGRDNTAMGLDLENGRILWQQLSPGDIAGVAGAGAPAAKGNLVVIPYASSEIIGVAARN